MLSPAEQETNGYARRARVEEVRKDSPYLFREPFSGVLQHAKLMQTRINAKLGILREMNTACKNGLVRHERTGGICGRCSDSKDQERGWCPVQGIQRT